MPPAGSEPTNPASERPQTHALDHAAAGIRHLQNTTVKFALNLGCSEHEQLRVIGLEWNAEQRAPLGVARISLTDTRRTACLQPLSYVKNSTGSLS